MAASKRCIMLAGAPESDILNWDEDALIEGLDVPVRRFVEGGFTHMNEINASTPSTSKAKWRSVRMDGERAIVVEHDGQTARSRPASKKDPSEADGMDVADYLEHSMAFLDDMDSSQIITVTALDGANVEFPDDSTAVSFTTDNITEISFQTSFNGSFTTTEASTTQMSPAKRSPVKGIPGRGPISNLKQTPKADYIAAIQPQTITVNLVVGIVSVSQTRTVHLRRRKGEMDIIEITVGDETRAGFSISFWLASVDSQCQPKDDLREKLSQLRTGDVIMLQNVALTSFRGNVHGQSLGRRFAKNSTSVTLLVDRDVSSPLRGKVERVREWTSKFVGAAKNRVETSFDKIDDRGAKRQKLDELPPDTQD